MKVRGVVWILLHFITVTRAAGQTVPLGAWQSHFSYLSAKEVVQAKGRIFCSTHHGLFTFNPQDQSFETYSKINGLSGTGVSSMAWDEVGNRVLVAYRSGNLDILNLDEAGNVTDTEPWPVFLTASGLPENKQVNSILFRENLAYLGTNFGIAVIDMQGREVLEIDRYIGAAGSEVVVNAVAFAGDSVYAATNAGVLAASTDPAVNRQYFANWKKLADAETIISRNGALYAAFSGKGIFKKQNNSWKLLAASESKTFTFSLSENAILIGAGDRLLQIDEADKVVTTSHALFTFLQKSLIVGSTIYAADRANGLLAGDTDFRQILPGSGDTTIFPRKDSSIVDLNGLTWTRLPAQVGGGILVKDPAQNQQRLLSTSAGNGSLPSNAINSLSMDEDGYIWFASDRGVGYIVPDDPIHAARIEAVLPVFGNRKLFSTEKCTAICTEPGNRKWIGTRTGLYQFNADGTEMVQKFTAGDSPLPSDQILALDFNVSASMLFVETSGGMVSYRSGASAAAENLSAVTIFPNPVRPGYGGAIGIKGLAANSIVKITELSGRLIFETRSSGGTATWNLNDYHGKRARGGIYMVFVVSSDGSETFAGKLAVID